MSAQDLDDDYHKLLFETDSIAKCYSNLVEHGDPMSESYQRDKERCIMRKQTLNDKKTRFIETVEFLSSITAPHASSRSSAMSISEAEKEEIWSWIFNVYERHPLTNY